MKLTKLLLRWYKSFHLNYRGTTEKGETLSYRPWNKMSPPSVPGVEFPFIEIPIECDITTIVGANESGKSHSLSAISKVVQGTGIDTAKDFAQTDLCHYAGIRTRNAEAWPNIGLQFVTDDAEEMQRILSVCDIDNESLVQATTSTFAVILAPDEEERHPAVLFIEPSEQAILLTEDRLERLRSLLPRVQFIDSKATLSSEIALARLLAAYGAKDLIGVELSNRHAVEEAATLLKSLRLPNSAQPLSPEQVSAFEAVRNRFSAPAIRHTSDASLEILLFRDILGITSGTLQHLYGLSTDDRGYTEGMIGKWNEEIRNQLNLSHFWHQDEQFTLSVDYKDGVIYFEIRDKTDSVYTFSERSSGLKFFLSYYIQAKAMEMASRNRNSIILMDEPDSALSILGQRNLLAVFESLVSLESSHGTCQLIYTTHSPYLINRNFPRRIRVVKKEDAEEGTQYIEKARARRYEPVRTALGIDSAPSLFLGADNLLLEGPTDQYLLAELIRVFATPENVGEFLDLNSVVTVSADGAGNVENVLEQSKWADEPIPPCVVLLDSDKAGTDAKARLTGRKGRSALLGESFVATLDTVVTACDHGSIVTLEDIIPRTFYCDGLKAYITRWLPNTLESNAKEISRSVEDESFGREGWVESTRRLFKQVQPGSDGEYDKMGVLQEVIGLASDLRTSGSQSPAMDLLRSNVVAICEYVRGGLARSRAEVSRKATTQAIKRIIHDFRLLNRANVPVTSLQSLFKRIERECAPVGSDAEGLLRAVAQYLRELDELRAAGQQRLVNGTWATWSDRLSELSKNPLTAGTSEKSS